LGYTPVKADIAEKVQTIYYEPQGGMTILYTHSQACLALRFAAGSFTII